MALYEICARYVDNPSHKTARQHWRWWKPVLTGVAGDDSKAEYRFFKRDVVTKAIAEINACTNIEVRGPIEYKERDNKTIAEIQFEVYLKDNRKTWGQPASPGGVVVDDLPIIGRAIQLGIPQREAEKLIEQFGSERVAEGLHELDKRLRMPSEKIGAVLKPGGWLRAHMTRAGVKHVPPWSGTSEISLEELQARRAAWTDEWLRRLKTRLQSGFEELPLEDQRNALDEYRGRLLAMQQHQLLRRLDQSGWKHRMVVGSFIKFYAEQSIGPEWDKPTQDEIMTIGVELMTSGAPRAREKT
jgi:hypothetical protein